MASLFLGRWADVRRSYQTLLAGDANLGMSKLLGISLASTVASHGVLEAWICRSYSATARRIGSMILGYGYSIER